MSDCHVKASDWPVAATCQAGPTFYVIAGVAATSAATSTSGTYLLASAAMVVRKYDDASSIKEWVSDDEEEDVSHPKTEKKTVRPSIVKKEFVKSKQQEKTARKTVKQVEQHRQNTHSPRG
ncbi:hypothetical protein Tco_0196164 [Tanacetum coccineum]